MNASSRPRTPRGRGAATNPPNRFETIEVLREDWGDEEDPAPRTQFLRDASRSAITYNNSPDIGYDASLNPYRGCEHGCIYCYARPFHEYLGFSAGLDFETRIMVKEDAPAILERELAARSWKPQPLALSGVTDAYQPIERRLRLTRRCLEVLARFRNPAFVLTKNHLVARDADLLAELARHGAASVTFSIPTLDRALHRVLEPRTSLPEKRLEAMRALAAAGVPTGVLVAPIIPGLNEQEIAHVLEEAASAGASHANYTMIRLPHAVAPLFEAWLGEHFPERKAKILNRIRDMRGGRLNDSRFGKRMSGEGIIAEQIRALFKVARRATGLAAHPPELSTAAFRRPPREGTLPLFEG